SISSTATRNLPLHHAGAGSGVYNTVRQVGAVLGSAAISAAMESRLAANRSEEHTSELQSRFDLVCRLLLEKKKGREHREDSLHTDAEADLTDGEGLTDYVDLATDDDSPENHDKRVSTLDHLEVNVASVDDA